MRALIFEEVLKELMRKNPDKIYFVEERGEWARERILTFFTDAEILTKKVRVKTKTGYKEIEEKYGVRTNLKGHGISLILIKNIVAVGVKEMVK